MVQEGGLLVVQEGGLLWASSAQWHRRAMPTIQRVATPCTLLLGPGLMQNRGQSTSRQTWVRCCITDQAPVARQDLHLEPAELSGKGAAPESSDTSSLLRTASRGCRLQGFMAHTDPPPLWDHRRAIVLGLV